MDSSVYTRLQDILVRASRKAWNLDAPELSLRPGIMTQAARDGDVEYFSSELFEEHCKTNKLNPDRVRNLCVQFIETVKTLKQKEKGNDNKQK